MLWQDANEGPISTCVSTNFSPGFNETDISPWIFIRHSEQLWQLEEADQAFKKEVSNYKRESLICTQGIKDTVHDYINFNGIFCIAYQCTSTKFRKVPHTAEQSHLVGFFTVSAFNFCSQKQRFFSYSLWVLLHDFFSLFCLESLFAVAYNVANDEQNICIPRKQTNIKLTGL